MAPVTKETLEVGNSTQPSAQPESSLQPKGSAGHSRSDVVSLEVPVKVHGSRYVSGDDAASQTERFEEQTATMIVFPEGGVLRMATAVSAGQMLVLTNLKSRQDAICRVVKVRNFPNAHHYVEVEFTRPQPGYWGVYFPSQGHVSAPKPSTGQTAPQASSKISLEAPPKAATPPPPPAARPVETRLDSKEARPTTRPPAPATRAPAAKPASTFVSLGTKEEVQPAAAATRELHPGGTSRELGSKTFPIEETTKSADVALESTTTDATSADVDFSSEDLNGASGNPTPAAEGASEFGEFFGAHRGSGSAAEESTSPERYQNWMLVAVGVAALFVTVAGGAWFFHARTARNNGSASNPAATAATSSVEQRNASVPQQSAVPVAPVPAPSGSSAAETHGPAGTQREPQLSASLRATAPAGRSASGPAQETANRAPAAQAQPAAVQTSPAAAAENPRRLLSAASLKAHPLSSQRPTSSVNQAPVIDATADASQPGSVPIPGSSSLALPPPTPEGPVRVGGTVKEPRLISTVMPVYPLAARTAHIQGDVLIDTQVSKSGRVGHMNVVSGPMILRQAALDALRRWKYEPSQLDGKPVDVELLIKIQFRL
ncbi:MAG TPA: TonB family protein [Candidatus Acidoferrales bacterium]|nr:TonB family protein [Candidatus Acidoferrales bacterium]